MYTVKKHLDILDFVKAHHPFVLFFYWLPSRYHTVSFRKKKEKQHFRHAVRDQVILANIPFYRYGGHIEFIRFKEYYGMPRGYPLSIYARFSGKKRTLLYISRGKRRSLVHPNTTQRSFFPIAIFFKENLNKNWPKKCGYIYWVSILGRAHAP